MFAIILDNDQVIGILPDYTEDIEISREFVVVETLPDILMGIPSNQIAIYKDGEFTLLTLPDPPPAPVDELAQLKQDNEKLKQDVAEQTAALLDIYDLVLGGV